MLMLKPVSLQGAIGVVCGSHLRFWGGVFFALLLKLSYKLRGLLRKVGYRWDSPVPAALFLT